ncbi:transcriptional regulator [Salmonella bongori]|nr:transcriptional regulator [Salmonella bongori]
MRYQCHHAKSVATALWFAETASELTAGHRLYSDDDVQQALSILDWDEKRRAHKPG